MLGAVSRNAGHVKPRRAVAVGPMAVLLCAVSATWSAHALEYLRVWGTNGWARSVSGSVHAYLGPVGVVLLIAGAATTLATSTLATSLEHRLHRLRRDLAHGAPSLSLRTPTVLTFPALVARLWVCQIPLYIVQENLEAKAVHLHAPGLGAVTGVHALAPVVHLLVALVAAGFLYLTRRRLTELAHEVHAAAARLAARWRATAQPLAPAQASTRSSTPAERWGGQRWCRPPPAAAAA
jgi:hypothetical protein